LKYVLQTLKDRSSDPSVTLGEEKIQYQVDVLDPHDVFGPSGALSKIGSGELTTPAFFLPTSTVPEEVKALKRKIVDADCYMILSTEYNHVVPPALSSLMGHFGGSCYACKPSAVVTYSPGPWGGIRAARSIQLLAHELGCLPVSKSCAFPLGTELLNEDGTPVDPSHRMLKQLPTMLNQLDWMAVAMKRQRELTGACVNNVA
jgi:NAD(P)H-dependent FMN reductase